MSDATICRVLPALNDMPGQPMHFTFAIVGTNLSAETTVIVRRGRMAWVVDTPVPHGSDGGLLMVKINMRGPDSIEEGPKDKPLTKQIEQITVTVHNEGQTQCPIPLPSPTPPNGTTAEMVLHPYP